MDELVSRTLQCENLRSATAHIVRSTLPQCIGKSEIQTATLLRERLGALDGVASDGWYDPPPGGVIVLADNRAPYSRLSFKSLREAGSWPSQRILEEDSVVTSYVSPYLSRELILGDFGCSLYFGRNTSVGDHLKNCELVMSSVAKEISAGMRGSQLHLLVTRRLDEYGLINQPSSSNSDPTGANLGHSVPFAFPGVDRDAIMNGHPRELISKSRRFFALTSDIEVPKWGCFTLEAQLRSSVYPDLPTVLVHLMIRMEDGLPIVLE